MRILAPSLLALLVPAAASGEARAPYGGTIVAPLPSQVVTIDPARASRPGEIQLVALVFDAPFALDGIGRVKPRLAASLDGEGTRVRLVLRSGLKFSDGRALTAADVAASLSRAARLPGGWTLAPIKAARAAGDEVVELDLARAAPDLAALLATPAASVTVEGREPAKVVGSGPFRWGGHDLLNVRLAANALHPDGRPLLDGIQMRWFASRNEEAALYEVGSTHVSLHGATAFEGGTPKHRTTILDGPRTVTVALAFGKGAEPRSPGAPAAGRLPEDAAFRRALGGALDRERLRRLAVREPSLAAVGLATGGPPRPPLTGDRAKARTELGRFTAGGRLRAALLIDGSRFEDREVAEKLLTQFADLGIDLTVDAVDARAYGPRLESGRYDLALVEAGAIAGPEQPGLAALALVAAIDPRLARALLLRGPADVAAVEKAIAERATLWPLFHRAVRAHHRADLSGLAIDAAGRVDYAGAWVAKP